MDLPKVKVKIFYGDTEIAKNNLKNLSVRNTSVDRIVNDVVKRNRSNTASRNATRESA